MAALANVLVVAEHDNVSIRGATLNTVTAALEIGKFGELGCAVRRYVGMFFKFSMHGFYHYNRVIDHNTNRQHQCK